MIKAYWNGWDTRQRYLAVFAASGLLLALVLTLVVFPLWEAKAKMTKSIAANTRKLEEMKKLDAEFAASAWQIARMKNAIAQNVDFTLFSYLEKKAVAAGVKGAITQMNSLAGARSSSVEENLIDLKLEKITIAQLADFLYQVESQGEMIRIKRITVDKMKESPDYLSVQLLVASYMPASPVVGGP